MQINKPLLIVFLAIIIINLVSHFIYHRSFFATLIEILMKIFAKKKVPTKRTKYDRCIKSRLNKKDKRYKLPKFKFISNIKENIYDGCPVYELSNSDNSEKIILYLHGGSYILQPLLLHWTFCDRLSKDLNAKVIFPIYPLVPNHNWEETYKLVYDVYCDILKETNKQIIIMGDSAGGGLALGFCEYLAKKNMKQPDKLILISPWLDITLSNKKIKNYLPKDPLLEYDGLVKVGKLWAGEIDTKDYKVSPMFGSLDAINNIYLFVGTREILYPDITEFYKKLQENKIKSKLFIGKELNHVYPLYPIPEARKAYSQIISIIK